MIAVDQLERPQLEALLVAHRLEFVDTCIAHERADQRQAQQALDHFEAETLQKAAG